MSTSSQINSDLSLDYGNRISGQKQTEKGINFEENKTKDKFLAQKSSFSLHI